MNQNKNRYFYSEIEDQIIVNSITEDLKQRQLDRRPFELSWEINMNFYLGNHYSYISTTNNVEDSEKKYYWENREVYNHIAPLIESRLAKLNKINPILNIKPASNSDSDVYSAKLTKSILKSNLENNSFNSLISTANCWSEITGTSFYKITWDNDLGDIIGIHDNKTIKNGDVKISLCSPFEIYPDSNSSIEIDDCESIIAVRAYPVNQINAKWNLNLTGDEIDICELGNQPLNSNFSGRGHLSKITHAKKYNHVLLIERYEKPNTIHPNGKYTIICKDKLLYDSDLPYIVGKHETRGYPFVKQVSIKQLACFWGLSVIERCIPIQRAYNALKNKKHEYISRLASGVLTVEDGSVDIDNLENEGLPPGKIIIYRNGSTPPKFLDPGTIPSELECEEEKLLTELNTLSCVSDLTTSSNVPNNINSGSAINLLLEQDESRLSLIAENVRSAIKNIGTKIVRLYKQFATSVRLHKLTNENNIELFYWNQNDLSSDDIILESNNELTESSETKKQTLLSLYDRGLLFDNTGKISNSNKSKILNMLGFNNWETYEDINEIHKTRAINENLNIINLEDPLNIDNHQIHIEEHSKYILTDVKNTIEQTFKEKLLQHIEKHKLKIQ